MNGRTKLAAVLLVCAVILASSGCSSLLAKKDTLIFTSGGNVPGEAVLSTSISSYNEEDTAILLYYSSEMNTGLYNIRESTDNRSAYSLYLFDENGERLLFSGPNPYTSAMIDPFDGSVYFKESSSEDLSVTLYRSDFEASVKTAVTTQPSGAALPYYAAEGTLYYTDKDGILTGYTADGTYHYIYTFIPGSSVRKIYADPASSTVYVLSSISARSTLLFSLDMETAAVTPIDAGVSDFMFSPFTGRLYYIKSAGSSDQLYSYSPDTYRNRLLYSGSVERFAVSPQDDYIVFITRNTQDTSAQSLWVITMLTGDSAQLLTDTVFYGALFFTGENSMLFTTAETTEQTTVYKVKRLEFITDYSRREQR